MYEDPWSIKHFYFGVTSKLKLLDVTFLLSNAFIDEICIYTFSIFYLASSKLFSVSMNGTSLAEVFFTTSLRHFGLWESSFDSFSGVVGILYTWPLNIGNLNFWSMMGYVFLQTRMDMLIHGSYGMRSGLFVNTISSCQLHLMFCK